MTAIPGTVGITGLLAPKNSEDTHPTHEDTYGRGGFRPVADTTARDAIPADRLKVGMLVYSIADDLFYRCTDATAPTWVEAEMGGSGDPVAPEFVLVSPRTIADEDHNLSLVSTVAAGLIVNLPATLTPGTTVYVGSMGFDVTFLPSGGGQFVGAGPMQDALGLQLQDNGSSLNLVFLGTPIATPLWAVVGGQGIAYVTDGSGTPTGAYHVFDSGSPITTTLSETVVGLVDDTDFTATEATPYITEGVGYAVEVTPTTGTGNLTVELYQDAARLELVSTLIVDLANATTYRSAEAFGFELETPGTLYGTAFVSGVAGGATFDISIKAIGTQPLAAPIPIATPYGQGIEDDGTGKPRIALPAAGGLSFDGGDNLAIRPDVTEPATIALGVGGASVTGAVTTTTDEDIGAKKRFTAVGPAPLLVPGPPTSGTYLAGHETTDSDNVKWRCYSGGSPGTWELADCVGDVVADYETDYLIPGATEVIEILTTGNVGILQRLQIWGEVNNPADYSSDFRLRIYPDVNYFGRNMVWQGIGIARQSYITTLLAASSTNVLVNDENQFNTDEACVIFSSALRYELARISARTTGQVSIDEALEDPASWAVNTLVCGVAQFDAVPFRNTDATPSNQGRIFLQIRNDSDVNTVRFFVRALPLSIGKNIS